MSRLIVKNLPLKITEDKLLNTFSSQGKVTDLQLKYKKDGTFRGFAFVGFKSAEEAEAAIKYFDGTYIGAAKVSVQKCLDLGDIAPRKKGEQMEEKPVSIGNIKKEAASVFDKYKNDKKFQEFLRIHKRNAESWTNESVVEVANLYQEQSKEELEDEKENDINDNEKDVPKPKNFKTLYHVKITNLPKEFKKKVVKTLFHPLKPASIRIMQHVRSIAFVGFKTEKERDTALLKNKSMCEGKQILVVKYEKKTESAPEDKGNEKWKEQEESVKQTETIGDSGRIFIRNLSYSVTEDEIKELFEKFGPVAEVNLPIDKLTRRSKGFGFVTYMMPEHAVQAFSELDGSTHQGRLLHLLPAKSRDETEQTELEGSHFKKNKQLKDKKNANKSHNWNSLFLGASAVADLMSEKYDVAKADIVLGDDSKGGATAAVRLALGETQIIQETKKYLESEGVRLQAFDKPPEKRSRNIMIAKNLPAKTAPMEIKDLFAKYGVLGRVVLPPGGITAVIEFADSGEARSAFTNLAYTKFYSTPLYLEWAPEDTFSTPYSEAPPEIKEAEKNTETKEESEKQATPEENSTLYIKNVNFKTTDDALAEHFLKCGKIYSCNVAKKKDRESGLTLSMGFGFVTYWLKSSADQALKELQFVRLDDHALELKRSNRLADKTETDTRKQRKEGEATTKIMVRNVAFEATSREIEALFKIYGELTAVRMPKKINGSHRGFAFVEFSAKTDAKKAMAELSGSTHLYGRRLVLEWAEQEESLDELRKRTADQFNAGSRSAGKRTKFEMADENPAEDD